MPLWYSHKKIITLLSELDGYNVKNKYRSMSAYLLELVKSGHLERTVAPPEVSKRMHGTKEYLYRRTGKSFKRGYLDLNSSKSKFTDACVKGIKAHEIYRLNRNLPKWFRKMMMD